MISKDFQIVMDKEAHSYRVNGHYYDSVTTIMQKMGLYDCYRRAGDPEVMNAHKRRGTAVHATCELFDKDELDLGTVHPKIKPYLDAWIAFTKQFKPTWYHIEEPCASVKMKYAGTIDRIGLINGFPWVIDIKASESTIPATKLQLAGYDIAYREMIGESKFNKRAAVLLRKTGDYTFIPYEEQSDYTGFYGMVGFYFWKRKERMINE